VYFILTIAAGLTAIISGVIGMGGGILLLSLMTFFLVPTAIIPIHGIVQLISNSARTFYLKEHINIKIFCYYCIGLPLGAALSTVIIKDSISDRFIYLGLVIIIFYTIFKPKKLPQLKVKEPYWVVVGFITGILAILVGAVGPFLAAFFMRDDFTKEEIVSSKSAMQLVAHSIKIPAFLYLDFNYFEHIYLIIPMCIAVIIGTKVGVLLLKKVDSKRFKLLFRSILFIAGLRIFYKLYETLHHL
jgi:uncharacterized membrane protein YfcA